MTTQPPDRWSQDLAALLAEATERLRTEPDRALGLSVRGARCARADGDAQGLRAARSIAADALLYLSRPLAAARVLRRVAAQHATAGDPRRAQHQLLMVAQALVHADHHVEAEAILRDADRYAPLRDDVALARRLHVNWAALEFRRERPREALRHYRLFWRLPVPQARGAAVVELNTANSLSAAGRPNAAHRRFTGARKGLVAAGASTLLSSVDQNEAYAYLREGDLGHALDLFDHALDAAEESSELALFPALCLDRAELFLLLAMPAEARREIERLHARVPRLTELDEAHAAFVDAFAQLLVSAHGAAARGFCDVASNYQHLGFLQRAAHCRILEARARLEDADLDGAQELVERARTVLESRHDPRRVSADLLAADISCRRGDLAAARAHLSDATSARGDRLPPWMHLEIARTEAEIAHRCGDSAARCAALTQAADALDAQMGRLPVDEYLIPFLGARSWLFEGLAADRLDDGDLEAAFEAVERGRARALLELLGAPTRAQATLGEHRIARRRRELGVAELQLHEAATRADGVNPDQLNARARRLADTRERAEAVHVADPRPWAGARAKLPTATTVVEYAWIEDRLHAFIVRHDSLAHRLLRVTRAEAYEISQRVSFQFRTARTRPHADRQDHASRQALEHHLRRAAEVLWEPLADSVPPGDVVIVPTEHLNLLPFHALLLDGDTAPRHAIAYAPSVATFVTPPSVPRARGDTCSVFALADSDAPQIGQEAQAIAAAWADTDVLIGAAASLAAFRRCVETSRIVHVATHGVFHDSAPLFSSLRLADAWVNAYDVYDMRIGAELVILAACETARSVASRDADLLGLLRAFLVAGAGNVLAPQWPVSDAAARTYVVACFVALDGGATPADAARRAAAATREQFPHPVDWAGWFPYCRARRCVARRAGVVSAWSVGKSRTSRR